MGGVVSSTCDSMVWGVDTGGGGGTRGAPGGGIVGGLRCKARAQGCQDGFRGLYPKLMYDTAD